ncbi:MAG: cytochrome P450 [Acidobacteriota bacterium]|nr:cytochrome P450 [Acidobacteriota bacterium]
MSHGDPSKYPPGPESGALQGIFSPFRRDPLTFLTGAAKKYGDIVGLRFLHYRTYFISHPDYIEDVLVKNSRKFIKGRVLQANKRLFGNGLLTSEGDFWLRQRRLAQPAFHRQRIASYADVMVRYSKELIAQWKDGEQRDAHQEMMQLTLQIVGKTLFDADVTADAREVGQAITQLLDFSADFRKLIFTPKWLPTPTNIQTALAIRRLNKIVYRIIAERRKSRGDTGDLLSMLLSAQDEDGSRMNDLQLRDETLTLFLAGYETTANLLAWTWWLLANHPEVENKLHRELETILAGRTPTLDDLQKLRYTGNILTESLRLYPPAWGMARLAIEDHEIAGFPVPAGTGVAIAQWVVHRDPRWYDAPDEYRPERWEGDLQKRLPRFAYFPFGGGARQCIGNTFALMEATFVLATIAQRFRLKVMANQEITPLASITLRPRNGIQVQLESRRRTTAENDPLTAVANRS